MLHPALFLLLSLGVTAASVARAETLTEAWTAAYRGHPALMAERAKLRAAEERISLARSGFRPSLEAVGGIGLSRQYASTAGSDSLTPRDAGLRLTQPVFTGFQTVAAVDAAEAALKAERAALENAEQETLYATAEAYLDAQRSKKVLALTRKNEDVLRETLKATEERFKLGEVTKTDISQAEARLSAATARRIRAEGSLVNDRAAYRRAVGTDPVDLRDPALSATLPATLDDLAQAATTRHPALIAATSAEDAAKADISRARGKLLPSVDLIGSASEAADQNIVMPSRQKEATIMARLTIPLYKAGEDIARTRIATETATQKRFETEDTRDKLRENATRAWQNLKTAEAAIQATHAQKDSADLALHGVQEEHKAGTRTVLDILNAEQEALSAHVDLIQAEHDRLLALLQVRAAQGDLTARALSLAP